MLPDIGMPVAGLPHVLVAVRDLERFEGTLLSEHRAEGGGATYVEKWCAQSDDGGVQRSLVVRAEARSIGLYLERRLRMRELLEERSQGVGFLVDRAHVLSTVRVVRVALVTLGELPAEYLPDEDTLHDEWLRP